MVLHNQNEVTPDIRKLQLEIAALTNRVTSVSGTVAQNSQSIQSLLTVQSATPPSPVGNLLWNGELGHSVHTWNDATAVPIDPADENEEAAWWFSHNAPAAAKTFTSVNVIFGSDTVTITAHGFTTGCTVDLLAEAGGKLPSTLTITPTLYYLVVVDANTLKFATTLANAFAGTPVDLLDNGTAAKTYTVQPVLVTVVSSTGSTGASILNNELKSYAHTTWDLTRARYSRWDATNGWAEMTGLMSVDALLPSNVIDATTQLARISMVAALRNSYIELPSACLMAAGVWDNTSGQRKFLTGSIAFTAALQGTAGATERRYKIRITSDRGYSLISNEVTIANAPADGAFTSTNNIIMSWEHQPGQLQVEIYEYLPGIPGYRLLTEISAATSYIHEGSYLRAVLGYPSATGTALTATYFTRTGEMADLNINGVDASWDTVNFPDEVPANYNKGNTTDRQFVRIWLTVAPNLYITGCTTDGTATITIPTGAVNSAALAAGGYGTGGAGASLYYGLSVEVYDSAGTAIGSGRTVASVTSDTVIVLSAAVAAGSARIIRIVGGGFHGVLIDKIHLGFQLNTSYAPNALDNRTLQPRAAPSSSSQGGGGSGGGGGGINCIAAETPIKLHDGSWPEIRTVNPGTQWASAGLVPNLLTSLREGMDQVRRVSSANGCEIICTDTECFVTDGRDVKGTRLSMLRVGDHVLTEIDGRIERSRITAISRHLGMQMVYSPRLNNNSIFIGGALRQSVWRRVTGRARRHGGFVLHNRKVIE